MSLPKGFNIGFEHAFKQDCLSTALCINCRMHGALTIAVEALEHIWNSKAQNYTTAGEALRRIAELGEEVKRPSKELGSK